MATLNLSTNGPSISNSYRAIVEAPGPSGPASSSPTYGQWVVYSVTAPLVSAFQQDSGKESVLKVQSTGEGELIDLIDEFSDGRIQFAFVKVKDPNTTLAKSVLIAWCGEGVPERTKGYFTSHLAAVSKLLHGYHVQITARTDNDLTPESIVRKVADSSGSRYSGDTAPMNSSPGPAPPVATKPVFMPTQVGGASSTFTPLGSRARQSASSNAPVDEDGWGEDAPPVIRTQLEKVAPAYQPTRVNMSDLTSQKPQPSRFEPAQRMAGEEQIDVVKGDYQPIGKVDIAAIRRQAQEAGNLQDDRPGLVKGAYEPVGKVDIAAIKARAQPAGPTSPPAEPTGFEPIAEPPKSLAERSAAFSQSERVTTMPKPKVTNRFGATTSNFTGTKPPVPGGFESKPAPSAAPVGVASKNFADEGGKTPAQIWAEKRSRQRGSSGAADAAKFNVPVSTMAAQTSGSGEWESGYTGKKWAPVQTTRTGQSSTGAVNEQLTGEDEEPGSPSGNVSAIRDRFREEAPMGRPSTLDQRDWQDNDEGPPAMDLASKPNVGAARGVPIPGLPQRPIAEPVAADVARMPTPPAQPPRSPTPPTPQRSESPIQVVMPVSRGKEPELEPAAEQFSPPPMPTRSMLQSTPHEQELEEEPAVVQHDPARAASEAVATAQFGASAVSAADPGTGMGGKSALILYDYEKAEDNEIELVEGQYVTNIDMVDEDWWMGQNNKGESGLFPANYVELVDNVAQDHAMPLQPEAVAPVAAVATPGKPTATAQFDYDAAEDNELSFPDGAIITDVEFPDEDWWLGEYNGHKGLFPANYVQLN